MSDPQSSRHLLMVEPASFYANPETMETNVYQAHEGHESKDVLFQKALAEFRGLRDVLVEHGVVVTTVRGYEDCPDMVFPNWFSTHADGTLVLYPMLNDNRRAERAPFLIDILKKTYGKVIDLTPQEHGGLILEANGSLVLDRVHKVAYGTLSARTIREAAEAWAVTMRYELHLFETVSHTGKPVYHTDLVMNIGTGLAVVCDECIVESDRQRVLDVLSRHHEVMTISSAQLQSFCGNALEVIGADDEKMFVTSSTSYHALEEWQIDVLKRHYTRILHVRLDTLEIYGGGSARCCIAELF